MDAGEKRVEVAAVSAAPAAPAAITTATAAGSRLVRASSLSGSLRSPPRDLRVVGLRPRDGTAPVRGRGSSGLSENSPRERATFHFLCHRRPRRRFLPTRDRGLSMVDIAVYWLCAGTHRVCGPTVSRESWPRENPHFCPDIMCSHEIDIGTY